MANKRFYWLKLKEGFFQQKAMKKLRRMERGEVLTVVYLKMQLSSLRNGGVIAFEGFGDSFFEELSLQLDELEDDVTATVNFLIRYGLMEQVDGADTYMLPGAVENTGSEGGSAARMRALRERKTSHCDGDSLQSDGASHCDDREKREEKREQREDSEREGDSAAAPPAPARDSRNMIFWDDEQYSALVADLGEQEVERCIGYLSEYCSMKGRPYKDWDAAIRKASREKWGLSSPKPGSSNGKDFQPTQDRIQKNSDWLDEFLKEQGSKPKWNLEATEL